MDQAGRRAIPGWRSSHPETRLSWQYEVHCAFFLGFFGGQSLSGTGSVFYFDCMGLCFPRVKAGVGRALATPPLTGALAPSQETQEALNVHCHCLSSDPTACLQGGN